MTSYPHTRTENKYKETRMLYENVAWNGNINKTFGITVDLILRQPKMQDVVKGQIHYLFS